MSGIGDGGDNSDLQRIREVNQAELRRRVDQQKRGNQARVERSFKEVMAEQGRHKQAQETQHKARAAAPRSKDATATERLMAQVRSQGQRADADLGRKAALSRSMVSSMGKGRTRGHHTDALQSESRAEQLLAQSSDELEHVRETARDDEARDFRSTEEKQAEIAAEARGDGAVQRDGQQRRRQDRDRSSNEDGPQAEGVQSSDGPAPAHRVHIPPALIQQLVNAVFKAVGPDGRTEMQIHLRGGPLDGVKLEVRSENGRVECTFHGCDRKMENLIKQGRPALAKGLEKRGLKLAALTVA